MKRFVVVSLEKKSMVAIRLILSSRDSISCHSRFIEVTHWFVFMPVMVARTLPWHGSGMNHGHDPIKIFSM